MEGGGGGDVQTPACSWPNITSEKRSLLMGPLLCWTPQVNDPHVDLSLRIHVRLILTLVSPQAKSRTARPISKLFIWAPPPFGAFRGGPFSSAVDCEPPPPPLIDCRGGPFSSDVDYGTGICQLVVSPVAIIWKVLFLSINRIMVCTF